MYMPWGKYKGQPIDALPSSYLIFLREGCDLKPRLAAAVARELAARFALPAHRGGPARPYADLEAKVAAWFRKLCLQFHPDRGGSDQAMAALNVAREELCEALGLTP